MPYRSPYEAYPFLSEPAEDLRCDFEIATDRLASLIGALSALCPEYQDSLMAQETLVYHANAGARTDCSLTDDEIAQLADTCRALRQATAARCRRFVLPRGSLRVSISHLARADCKAIVRLLYRLTETGVRVDTRLIDYFSLLSEFFFRLALQLNEKDGVAEVVFNSRNYPAKRS